MIIITIHDKNIVFPEYHKFNDLEIDKIIKVVYMHLGNKAINTIHIERK